MPLLVGLLVQACMAEHPGPRSTSGAGSHQGYAAVPRGAIQIGEELYQVPIGADDDGCPMFRLHSPTRLVAQAIYYRDAVGGFTTNKQEAACASRLPD